MYFTLPSRVSQSFMPKVRLVVSADNLARLNKTICNLVGILYYKGGTLSLRRDNNGLNRELVNKKEKNVRCSQWPSGTMAIHRDTQKDAQSTAINNTDRVCITTPLSFKFL